MSWMSWWKLFFRGSLVLTLLMMFCCYAPSPAVAQCGEELPLPQGSLVWPIKGDIITGWTLDCTSDRGHRGIDIAAMPGAEVVASAGGEVTFSGYTPAEGGSLTLSITHEGGIRSTYLHLDTVSVAAGQQVEAGQAVGISDGTPLHLGLKQPGGRDVYFNPLTFLPAIPGPQLDAVGIDERTAHETMVPLEPEPQLSPQTAGAMEVAVPEPSVNAADPAAGTATIDAVESRLNLEPSQPFLPAAVSPALSGYTPSNSLTPGSIPAPSFPATHTDPDIITKGSGGLSIDQNVLKAARSRSLFSESESRFSSPVHSSTGGKPVAGAAPLALGSLLMMLVLVAGKGASPGNHESKAALAT
jgi:hypothetical protein